MKLPAFREHCLRLITDAPMTTDDVMGRLGLEDRQAVAHWLSKLATEGAVARGQTVPRTRKDALGPKTLCTWVRRETSDEARSPDSKPNLEVQHVRTKPAPNRDSFVASALAARPDVQCAMAGWRT